MLGFTTAKADTTVTAYNCTDWSHDEGENLYQRGQTISLFMEKLEAKGMGMPKDYGGDDAIDWINQYCYEHPQDDLNTAAAQWVKNVAPRKKPTD
jgi:hypothetical protein